MSDVLKSNEPIKRNRYILGAGLAGLLAGYFNPRYKIIGKKMGGQFKTSFSYGPRYIHDTPEFRNLLDSLKVPYIVKQINVGYYYKGQFTQNIDDEGRIMYYKKSRLAGGLRERDYAEILKHTMTSGKTKFDVLEIDMNLFLKKMPPIIEDEITEINTWKRYLIGKKEIYYYSHLITTIPAPTFDKLRGAFSVYYSCSISYFLIESTKINLGNYDYVYYVDNDDEMPWHRITKVGANLYVVEIAGLLTKYDKSIRLDKIKKLGKIIKLSRQKYGEVEGKGPRFPIPRIINIGRYATWDHSKRLHEVLKDVSNLEKTIKNQRRFKKPQFKRKTKGDQANDTKSNGRSNRVIRGNKLGAPQAREKDNKK